jgi:hypothetical protein
MFQVLAWLRKVIDFYFVDELLFLFVVENMSSRFSRTIYVGNLPSDIRESEIEDLFYKV